MSDDEFDEFYIINDKTYYRSYLIDCVILIVGWLKSKILSVEREIYREWRVVLKITYW